MSKPINLVLFGDQTVEKLSSIRSLVRNSKSSAGAARLLREATDTLQLNFAKLAKEDRNWNHEIHTLLGLAEDNVSEENRNEVIATVLMCIGRLGELVLYAEEDPSIMGTEQDPVHVLAFCTGLLPAAALVAARDTSDLFSIGIEIISVTFRMACEISRRCRLIEDTKRCWAMTVVGETPEKVQPILDEFHATQRIPYPKRVAISVISNGWLTLIGAPTSLSRLMKFSKELDRAPKIPTDTDGAVHTQYIPRFDMDKVLGDSALLDTPITSKAKIVSPGSCKQYSHTSLRPLLAEVMVDIAHNVLHINQTIEGCVTSLMDKGPISLAVAGPTGHLAAVERALQNNQIEYSFRQHQSPQIGVKSRAGSDLVAIVGMSGRFPGSDTVESFFEDLLRGKDQIQQIPQSRFNLDAYFDSTGKRRNTTSAQHGAFLDHPGHFDNRLFNISPREATQMDPIQRLLLMTSYEALESAGYSKNASLATESNRIATYFGQASEDWRDVLNNNDIDIYHVPSISRPFGPSRLGYHHKWGGGTYALDAACATSTTAIHLACSALKSRECDTALAGGGSILVSPYSFVGLSKSGMISNNGGCRTFHDDADGYVRGEGIGVVVLKRLEDAYAENDHILGVIRGSARTYTSTSTSITHPSAESQSRIYQDILRQTGVIPNEIAYVEMHGTGTQAGDFEEMTSVIDVMGKGRSKENVLTVGAVKANVGHGEGAAGVTSLIKVLMMMQHRKIPPQPGIPFKLNHRLPKLEPLHVQIAGLSGKNMALKPSPLSNDKKIKCVVNSFDASGGNTSLIVEEAPAPVVKGDVHFTCYVVGISGKTTMSLKENRRRLLDYLVRNPDAKIADIAYTATARRMHEAIRVAYTAKTTRELTTIIRKEVVAEPSSDPKMKPPAVHVVFTFTGQGSHYAGMGKQLYQHSSAFRDLLNIYQQMGCHQGLPTFLHLITDDKYNKDASSAICVQLAIVALEIATAHLLKIWGVTPAMVIGHSLGEYSALCVSGVLSISDTLFLVGKRAKLMENNLKAGDYAMLAVSKNVEDVRQLLLTDPRSAWINSEIACINSPQSTVVSGPIKEIEDLKTELDEVCRTTMLNVPYGFHSRHVEAILDEFESTANGVAFSTPIFPVASTLLGEVIPAGKIGVFSPSYLSRQAREPVQFVGAIEASKIAGFAKLQTQWIEVGPGSVCTGLVRRILEVPPNRLLSTTKSEEDNWVTICSTLAALYSAGSSINWPQYYKEYVNSLSLVDIPTYAFDVKEFWTPYVEHVTSSASPSTNKLLRKSSDSPAISRFSTTSLQWVEEESLEKEKLSVTFASHVSEPNLYAAIQGHSVNGLTICSLSIFCDMAKSAAQYAYQKLHPNRKLPTMSVSNIDMAHALVVPEPDPGLIVTTRVSYPLDGRRASITFRSTKLGLSTDHGSCEVVFEESKAWLSQFSQTSFLVKARIESLKSMSAAGKVHRLLKPVIYKLFKNLVAYSKDYQGMEEIWVDSECLDAVGTIRLPMIAGPGNFIHNPYWMDTAIHLAGFLLNGGLKYPEEIACLSTGFESSRLLEELQPNSTYTTYVSMQELETPNTLSGSAYVYDDKYKLVQVTTGIKFLKMKKVVLDSVLRPNISSSTGTNKTTVKFEESATFSTKSEAINTGNTTPETHSHENSADENEPTSPGAVTPASSISENGEGNLIDAFLAIVSSESAFSIGDMSNETAFADMGVDSLMAITIIAVIQKETGVELPATFFLDNPKVGDVKSALSGFEHSKTITGVSDKIEKTQNSPSVPVLSVSKELFQKPISEINENSLVRPSSPIVDITSAIPPTNVTFTKSAEIHRQSKAIILQGSPSSIGPKMFLFPDGSGSPSRYIQIPALASDVNMYALESPFLKAPIECTWNFGEICDLFFTAMKQVQARGPYVLVGLSLGAIYAYEIAHKLLKNDEQVDSLILIDMPVPKKIDAVLSPTEDELRDAGIVATTGRSSKAQKAHIAKSFQAMMNHRIYPCLPHQRPKKTVVISSMTASAARGPSDLARCLQGSSSASYGWEEMVGPVEMHEIETDHFSLLKAPAVKVICKIILNSFVNSTSENLL